MFIIKLYSLVPRGRGLEMRLQALVRLSHSSDNWSVPLLWWTSPHSALQAKNNKNKKKKNNNNSNNNNNSSINNNNTNNNNNNNTKDYTKWQWPANANKSYNLAVMTTVITRTQSCFQATSNEHTKLKEKALRINTNCIRWIGGLKQSWFLLWNSVFFLNWYN